MRQSRAGAAMVEMALVLPLFILVMVGILEFGRWFMVQHMVTNASREGARHASMPNTTADQVVTRVRDSLVAGRISPDAVQVTVEVMEMLNGVLVRDLETDLQNATAGKWVRVEVQVPYSDVAWLPTPGFLGDTQLQDVTIVRHE